MSSDCPLPAPVRPPVVGIGASAGGLSALLGLLEHLPPDCGLALVAELHLPGMDADGILPILARGTSMPVVQLTGPATLEANRVYLLPTRRVLVAEEGSLSALPAGNHADPRASLDQFFRCLADTFRERCIGVVLSGAHAEGSVGLARVREQGGVTIAQAPGDADHDGMPRAAIASGAVDLILPVSEMAEELVRLRDNAAAASMPRDGDALTEIMEILRLRTRHEFAHYKQASVLRRIQRRIQVNGLRDLSAYRDHLRDHTEETPLLLQDLLISVTSFFRDPTAMEALERDVLPSVLQGHPGDRPVRVWVVGCATGEEAYSVSIQLHEAAAAAGKAPTLQIFATDIDERALAVARSGLYPAAVANDVSPSRLAAFFVREDQHYRVNAAIRASVLFTSHNVLHDPPFSRLDLIVCRNLLIYLDREPQAAVLDRFRYALHPGGHLFLGMAETAECGAAPGAFVPVDDKHRIYVVRARADDATPQEPEATPSAVQPFVRVTIEAPPRPPAAAPQTGDGGPAPAQSRARDLHQRILVESAPASVLVNSGLDILHMTSGAGQFMVHTSGSPNASLMSNIHPDLRLELRLALLSAGESGEPVQVKGVPVVWRRGEQREQGCVDFRVVPHRDKAGATDLCLIVLEAFPASGAASATGRIEPGAAAASASADEAERLKDELRQTLARFDRTSEALRVSSTALEAGNAALRVAREELATRQEELQSLDEELTAVNQELKAKVEETSQISDDLQNLIASGSIISIFIDRGMNIRRYTSTAAALFALGSTASGRRLQEIARQLEQAPLEDDAAQVLRTLQPTERTVHGDDGRAYLARMQPYRTTRDSIEGVVLTLADVTSLNQAQNELRDAAEVLRLALEATADHAVIRLDQHGRIASWNHSASGLLGYEEQESLGRPFHILADADERDRETPEELLRLAREQGTARKEQRFRRKDGSTFAGHCVVTALYGDPGKGFVQSIQDLSNLREAQSKRDQLLVQEQNLENRRVAARRRQDELLHLLAGQLKRPLNLVQVNAEMLLRLPETRSIAVAGKIAASIGKAVASQSQIIDSLRDLSLARSGKLILDMRSVDLRELVEEAVRSNQHQAAAKTLSLASESDRDPMIAVCDPVRVRQIIHHLISNAIKFTHHGGVTVRLVRDGEAARLSVADTGVGLMPEVLETIFADDGPESESPLPLPGTGLGIGLPLVKALVAAHDGKIAAESEGTERGSCFTVWLRLAEMPQAAEPYPAAAGQNPLRGLRVVLVDDSVDLLTAFGALLTFEGALVESFDTAEAALERLLVGDVDLLISDLGMPGMDGYELIAQVRRQPHLADLPAIALTGYGRTRDPGHAVRSGFNAHTTKPAALEELKSIISLLKSL